MLAPQIVVAALDWTFAGSTLWALLPPDAHVSWPPFLGVFLLAQCIGLLSHVPGGLGVFETVVVTLLGGQVDTQAIVGALVAFRAVYYFGPLAVAALLLGAYELRRQRDVLKRATALVDDWAVAVPHVLAFACFVSGAILLLSGATPALHHRLGWLERVLPLVLLETSHFVGSIVGAALVLLARDLQRRLDAAYVATVTLLTIGIVASLLKGFDWGEALVLAITLAAILPARREFYRTGALVGLRFTPAWGAGIAAGRDRDDLAPVLRAPPRRLRARALVAVRVPCDRPAGDARDRRRDARAAVRRGAGAPAAGAARSGAPDAGRARARRGDRRDGAEHDGETWRCSATRSSSSTTRSVRSSCTASRAGAGSRWAIRSACPRRAPSSRGASASSPIATTATRCSIRSTPRTWRSTSTWASR
jgi:hypothetical protein